MRLLWPRNKLKEIFKFFVYLTTLLAKFIVLEYSLWVRYMIKNPFLGRIKNLTVYNFTSKKGLVLRRYINPFVRAILKMVTKRKVFIHPFPNSKGNVVNGKKVYPKLEKGIPYIFASTHSFDEDIIASLANIDRHAYVLIGTTDQIDYNPQMYAAWVNGIIYVDRLNPVSRKEALLKMQYVLEHGSSVLVFPEGGWNNTENLLVQELFASPYILSKNTGYQVVPIVAFNEHDSKEIHMTFGDPLDLGKMEKQAALTTLRDAMATGMYSMIENYSTPLVRSELTGDIHIKYMQARVKEYLRVNWSTDVWDEELTVYHNKKTVYAKDVWQAFANVKVTPQNAKIIAPILKQIEEYERYDFKKYIKKHWQER